MATQQLVSASCEDSVISTQDQVDEVLKRYKGERREVVEILQDIQRRFGYLPEQAMRQVAAFVGVPESRVYSIATFYSQFKLVPTGRNVIKVCLGNACRVRGGAKLLKDVQKRLGIKPGESTPDLEYALETVACLGACSVAPAVVFNEETYGQVTPDRLVEIIETQE